MITNQTVETSYTGDGVETEFVIPFDYQIDAQVTVYVIETNVTPNTITQLTQGEGDGKFTINEAGTKIVIDGGDLGEYIPTATQLVVVRRASASTQTVDYNENNPFPFADHEEQMDKILQIIQEQNLNISKKLGLAETSQTTTPVFPEPVAEGIVRWNAATDGLEAVSNEDLGLTASDIANVPAGTISATDVQAAINELDTTQQAHENDHNNPHTVAAFQVPTVPAGNLAADDVQEALNELQTDVDTRALASDLATHVLDQTYTHDQLDQHVENTSNPHSVTYTQVGAEPANTNIQNHISTVTGNPHQVTAAEVGNDTAQWNAAKIQGKEVDLTGIADGNSLKYELATDKFIPNTDTASSKVDKAGDTMTGDLTFSDDAIIQLDADGVAPTHAEGKLFYDPDAHTVAYYNDEADVKMNILGDGPRVVNETGVTIANGMAVKLLGHSSAKRPQIILADASPMANADGGYAIATHDIEGAGNKFGYVTTAGHTVNGVDTVALAAYVAEGWTEGDTLYVHPSYPGYYTNVKPSEPNHVIRMALLIDHANNGKLFVCANHQNAVDKKTKYNGLENPAQFTLSYRADTGEVTVTYNPGGAAVWCGGVRYDKTSLGSETLAHSILSAADDGKHYFYYDHTGALTESTTPWNLLIHSPLCFVYYRYNAIAANSKGLLIDERHPGGDEGFDDEDHRYKHMHLGTQLYGTPTISAYTLDSNLNASVQYAVASAVVEDEDLKVTMAEVTDGTSLPVLYLEAGGKWNWNTATTNSVLTTGGELAYNNPAGSQVAVSAAQWGIYWPFALQTLGYSVGAAFVPYTSYWVIQGQANYSTLALAQSAAPSNLLYLGNLTDEGVVIAKIIYNRVAVGGGETTYEIEENPTYYKGSLLSVTSTAFSPTSHSTLSNRTDANSHPASAVSTDTTNFNEVLSGTDTDVQTALDTIDAHGHAFSKISGTVPILQGGTGQTTQTAAFDALAPSTTKGDLIVHNGTNNIRVPVSGNDGYVWTEDSTSAAGGKWAAVPSAPTSPIDLWNIGIAASVGSNALTIALKDASGSDPSAGSPVKIGFRGTTATSGTYNQRLVTSARSLVVTSGSKLGSSNAGTYNYWIYAIDSDSAGDIRLGISMVRFDDTRLQSTTAEGGAGGADSNAVLYSDGAYTSVPIRVIGRITATEATAGTWATAPSEVSVATEQMLASDKIIAIYKTPTSGNVSDTVAYAVDYSTKVIDNHNAVVNAGGGHVAMTSYANGWKLISPRETTFKVTASVIHAAASGFNGTSERAYISVAINGSATAMLHRLVPTAADSSVCLSGSASVSVAAADVIQVYYTQNSGGTLTITNDATMRVSIIEQ